MSFDVYYTCYSSGASMEPGQVPRAGREDIASLVDRHVLERGDFLGLIDEAGTTVQMIRGGADRVWIEVVEPERQGARGAHMAIGVAVRLVEEAGESLRHFKESRTDLTFCRWDGTRGLMPFAIPADQIRSIAPGYGWCLASDQVTRGDRGVHHLRREMPSDLGDSGWRFFSGSETAEYLADSSRLGVYDVNTIANYQPDIIEVLDAPVGTELRRRAHGGFE